MRSSGAVAPQVVIAGNDEICGAWWKEKRSQLRAQQVIAAGNGSMHEWMNVMQVGGWFGARTVASQIETDPAAEPRRGR
jgi:hypothetical protein